jgi:hypothetical protein
MSKLISLFLSVMSLSVVSQRCHAVQIIFTTVPTREVIQVAMTTRNEVSMIMWDADSQFREPPMPPKKCKVGLYGFVTTDPQTVCAGVETAKSLQDKPSFTGPLSLTTMAPPGANLKGKQTIIVFLACAFDNLVEQCTARRGQIAVPAEDDDTPAPSLPGGVVVPERPAVPTQKPSATPAGAGNTDTIVGLFDSDKTLYMVAAGTVAVGGVLMLVAIRRSRKRTNPHNALKAVTGGDLYNQKTDSIKRSFWGQSNNGSGDGFDMPPRDGYDNSGYTERYSGEQRMEDGFANNGYGNNNNNNDGGGGGYTQQQQQQQQPAPTLGSRNSIFANMGWAQLAQAGRVLDTPRRTVRNFGNKLVGRSFGGTGASLTPEQEQDLVQFIRMKDPSIANPAEYIHNLVTRYSGSNMARALKMKYGELPPKLAFLGV